jgi:hypothetical protein
MIVVHGQQQKRDAKNSTQRGGGERPLVHRDAEEFEDNDANRDVDQNEQEFHD